jgi:branched-subunit amino acid transport protein
MVGAAATLIAMVATRNLFAAMIAGMGLVAFGRYFIGA